MLFVAYRAGISLLVYIAISLPLYQSLGLDLAHIGVLYSINGFTVLLFDLPTGFIADRLGYRPMLLAGVAIQALAFGLLALNYWQWPAYLLQVLLGVGQATARGSDGPLARKSAEIVGVEFSRYSRLGIAAMGVAEGFAGLGTAALAWSQPHSAPRVAMGFQAVIYLIILYIPWRMHEEPVSASWQRHARIASLVALVSDQLRQLSLAVRDELRTNKEAKWLVFYGATIGCTTQTVIHLVQPYFQSLHLDGWEFGAWWAGYHFLWAGFLLASGWYERLLGRWGALASLVAWGIATNGFMALLRGTGGLVVMVAFYFIRGVQMPIVLDYMTGVVRPDRRATLLAVHTTVLFGMYSVMNILLGTIAEHLSVRAAFGVSLAVYGSLGLVFIWLLRRAAH
jgi:MFS family permease